MSQMQEWDKILGTELKKKEKRNMADTEFKVMVVKVLTGLQRPQLRPLMKR